MIMIALDNFIRRKIMQYENKLMSNFTGEGDFSFLGYTL